MSKKYSILIAIFLMALFLGIFIGRSKWLTRERLVRAVSKIVNWSDARKARAEKEAIAALHAKDNGDFHSERALDSSLLPLVVTNHRAAVQQSFAKGAGAITAVGDNIVVVDWLGAVFAFENGAFVPRSFPSLPNNASEYLRSGREPYSAATLRLHDVEFVRSRQSIAVSYEKYDLEKQMPQLAVSVIDIDPITISPKGPWRTIYTSDVMPASRYAGQAGGGRLAVTREGKLILSVGDFNQDGVMIESDRVSQDLKTSFGKIFQLDWDGNPARLISRGHRNPQGLIVTSTGQILSTEHGPAGGDELNLIVEGKNYGWPNVTLGTDYDTYNWPHSSLPGSHAGYESPIFAWVPSIGVSNVIEVLNFDQAWNKDLLIASLKAQTLFRLRMEGTRVVYSEPIWIGQRLRDLAITSNGQIFVWTDDAQLISIRVDQNKLTLNKRGLGYLGQPELTLCMSCHHFDVTGPTHLAPTLKNIVGREVASDGFARYSQGLKLLGGNWTEDRLRAFIGDPPHYAPGTSMPKLPLSEKEVTTIVELLKNARP